MRGDKKAETLQFTTGGEECDMNTQFYTILVFVGLVGAEAWRLRRSGRSYPLNTTVSNMSCGLLSLCTGVFSALAFLFTRARNRHGWDRVWTFLGPPEWRPAAESKKARSPYISYNAGPESRFKKAAVACFAGGIVLGLVLTALPADGNLAARAGIATAAAISVWFSTRLFDGANVQEAK